MEDVIEENEEVYVNSYKVKLDNFEGPLDLLLHLIKESKMDIEDIHLADITEQYLDYIKDIEDLDLESASEFIQVAAILIEIKSKSILPVESDELEDDELDPEQVLISRLKELKLFKEACLDLQKIEDFAYQSYKSRALAFQ